MSYNLAVANDVASAPKLRGWKEISQHLRVDERTARRWERRGMPIHRLPGDNRSAVFAMPTELDQWLRRETPVAADGDVPQPAVKPWARAAILSRQRSPNLLAAVALSIAFLAALGWAWFAHPFGSGPPRISEARADARTSALISQARLQNARGTATGFRQAIALTRQALRRDPTGANAYAELAFALIRLPDADATVDRHVSYEHAQEAAQRALDFDPNSWLAHSTMGFIEYGYHWNFVAAVRHFREVVRLNPRRGPGHNQLGLALLELGDIKGALRELKLAADLEASNPAYQVFHAEAEYAAGFRSEAVSTWRQILDDDPNLVVARSDLRDDALAHHDYREAILQGSEVARLRGDRQEQLAYHAAERALNEGNGQAIPTLLLRYARTRAENGDRNFDVARAYSLLGDEHSALDALKNALNAREPAALAMRTDPLLAAARASPSFERLAAIYRFTPTTVER